MSEKKTVSIGLWGAGSRLRQVVAHLRRAEPRVVVAGVYDSDPLSLRAVREAFGDGVVVHESEEALLASGVEWIFIGSPNHLHARQAVAALEAGKHLFCEKPLATSLDDCLAVRDAVRRTGRTFAFGLVLRYAALYQLVRKWIAEGRIGELVSFEFNETLGFNHGGYIFGNWRRHRALAGTHLLEKCCHDLDLANWMVGSVPVRAASFGGRDFFVPGNGRHVGRIGPDTVGKPAYGTWNDPHRVDPFSPGADIADNQVAILQYGNGVRGTFHTNCNAGIPERRFYLCGTEGAIRADACTGVAELGRIGHEAAIERIDPGSAGGHAGGDERMAAALAATLFDGAAPLASIDEGLRACIAAFGIDQAMDEGRMIDLGPMWERAGILA